MPGIMCLRLGLAGGGFNYDLDNLGMFDTKLFGDSPALIGCQIMFIDTGQAYLNELASGVSRTEDILFPPGPDAAANYYLKVVRTSGNLPGLDTGGGLASLNTVYRLNATRTFRLSEATPGMGYKYIDLEYQFFTNPAGAGTPIRTIPGTMSYEWAP